jgi:23S rRNA pseudouridine1911/1915/1917 synthase
LQRGDLKRQTKMTERVQQIFIIPDNLGGMRLDQAITKLLPEYSRTQIQEWIKNESLKVNDVSAKTKTLVLGGETITIDAAMKTQPTFEAQAIALDIIHEDDALLVINKPAGMVVHPAAGNPNSTLLNALLHHCPELTKLPRAGIIHRLDKETTGLLVIAKTAPALKKLSAQLKARTISRIYQAIVSGHLISGGTIDEPIARHPIQRKRMAVIETGKIAITHYRLVEKYRAHTRLKVQLETGRTHQIRVHMAHIKHPLLGDPVYAGRLQLPKGATPELVDALRGFKRQALHASELSLVHPLTNKTMTWQAPLPEDMKQLIAILIRDNSS